MRVEHDILPLKPRHAFNIARMKDDFVRRTVVVRVIDDDGVEGWGEAPVSTPYYGETADTVAAVMPMLSRALEASLDSGYRVSDSGSEEGESGFRDLESRVARVESAMNRAIGGNRGAKSAVVSALCDLIGKHAARPLWDLWGLDPARAPRSSFTIAIDEPAVMAERAREASSFPILKVKIGNERDEAMLRAVRDAAPEAELKVDANTAWSVDEALAKLPLLEELGVALLEQPLHPDDVDGFARLRGRSRIPVYADESCLVLNDVHRLAGKVDGVNIKLAKCGSLLEARRMVDAARGYGMGVMLGCMLETTVGIAAGVQLAPLMDHLDLDGAILLADDPFVGPGIERDGTVRFNREPGLGVTRKTKRVEEA